jgi:hypothetical protein
MLLEKSKFTEGDIVSFKLVSGDEVIGKYVKEDMTCFTVARPVMLAMTQKGPAMAPVMMTVNPDNDYTITKSVILFHGSTVKEIADQYLFQTTGIQQVSAGSIVTG